jgi:hypothetical protein
MAMAREIAPSGGVTRRSGGRRRWFAAALVVLVVVTLELSAWVGLEVLGRRHDIAFETVPVEDLHQRHRDEIERLLAGEQGALVFDPELGWDLAPGATTDQYRIDTFGVRTDVSFDVPRPPEVFRIALCGDSFSFGADVITPFTLAETLMRLDPNLEVVNLGVPAYGPDQAWLRCRRMMPRYEPQLVLIGFIADNAGRVVNRFRPFYFFRSGLAMGKPRFVLRGSQLELLGNPLPTLDAYRELLDRPREVLPRLGKDDFHFETKPRPSSWDTSAAVRLVRLAKHRLMPKAPMWDGDVLNPDGEPLRISAAVLSGFAEEVEAAGLESLIALMPSRFDIGHRRDGDPTAYHHLPAMLEARGRRFVDLVDGFQELAPEVPLRQLARVHYTRRGNRIAALWLHRELVRLDLIPPPPPEPQRSALIDNRRARLQGMPSVQALSVEEQQGLAAEVGEGWR